MALGKVQVNNLNLSQGEQTEVERYFLFVGRGDVHTGSVQTLTVDTDLDAVLGSAESLLRTQIEAARNNAGENWSACVLPLADGDAWADAVDEAMRQVSVEAVVVTDPVGASTDLEDMQTKAVQILAAFMRPIFFMATTRALDVANETWADFQAAIKLLTKDVAAENVMIVPALWGPELGTLAGRLCNRAVTVADTPKRVNTGALVGEWSVKPADKDGRKLDLSILEDLDNARFSAPQWYPDYQGVYWGDGNTLDVNAGDYQVIENLRVVQKAMRRVYTLAVARIGDRRLNSTPASIAQNQTYFMRPLRKMSHSTTILGQTFPGEIEPPREGDIAISWPTKYSVEIYMTVRPYNCPKAITCNILLDLTNYATED
ncbi:MAG: hypothetical protein PWQ57_2018 [Desulfovibrionales bacterium]|nr:hypothetical protein [Desulfovibrionales bacterium]